MQGYPVSKALSEKAAWKFAQDNNIDLIAVVPVLLCGPSRLPEPPHSIHLSMSLITRNAVILSDIAASGITQLVYKQAIERPCVCAGNENKLKGLIGMQLISGSISIVHVEDVCEAHIFLAEKETASGRYICCAVNTSVPELAKFLSKRYPQYQVPTE